MTDETITVCPECDSAQIKTKTNDPYGAHDPDGGAYYCLDCHTEFDTPAERERRSNGNGGDFSDAYKALAAADPDEVLSE
jgi:hypothetical protein